MRENERYNENIERNDRLEYLMQIAKKKKKR